MRGKGAASGSVRRRAHDGQVGEHEIKKKMTGWYDSGYTGRERASEKGDQQRGQQAGAAADTPVAGERAHRKKEGICGQPAFICTYSSPNKRV
jgi:hypothetical protein